MSDVLISSLEADIPSGSSTAVNLTDAGTFAGAEPKGAILFFSNADATGDQTVTSGMSFTVCMLSDSTDVLGSAAVSSRDGYIRGDSRSYAGVLAGYSVISRTSDARIAWGTAAMVANGVQITPNASSTENLKVTAFIIGGDGVINSSYDVSTVNASGDYSKSFGWRPDVVFSAAVGATTYDGDAQLSFGVVGRHQGGSLKGYSTTYMAYDGTDPTKVTCFQRDGTIVAVGTGNDTVSLEDFFGTTLRINDLTTDGIDQEVTSFQTGNTMFVQQLSLELANNTNVHIDQVTLAASDTSWQSAAFADTPVGALLWTADDGAGSETTGGAAFTWTSYDATTAISHGFRDRDDVSTTEAEVYYDDNEWAMLKGGGSFMSGTLAVNGSTLEVSSITGTVNEAYKINIVGFSSSNSKIYHGTTEVLKVYAGTDRAYPEFP